MSVMRAAFRWRWVTWLAAWASLSGRGLPASADPPRDLLRPVRLTVGDSAELMGAPSPDGEQVAYVTDRNSTAEIAVVAVTRGRSRALVADWADAVAPRFSPDGQTIAYIGFAEDPLGDVCTASAASGDRECFPTPGTAESEVFWFPGGDELGVVRRSDLHEDFELVRVSRRDGRVLGALGHNAVHADVSPDGRWIVAVDVVRTHRRVGVAFALRASGALTIARARQPVGEPRRWTPPLPGATGLPAFSADGKWLYFAQYLNDTNFDGAIDGNDNGVLFRVPFDASQDDPLPSAAAPEQLTAAPWNCQYPAPWRGGLVATCTVHASLDVYSLPLEGAVPPDWDDARIAAEAEVARSPWDKLLLLGRLAARQGAAGQDASGVAAELVRTHLHLEELESAAFYARQWWAVAHSPRALQWLRLVALRRAAGAWHRGGAPPEDSLPGGARDARATTAPGGREEEALTALVDSEEADLLRDPLRALAAWERVELHALHAAMDIELYARRAVELGRRHGRRELALEALWDAAAHPDLQEVDQLRYANAYVTELSAGLGPGAREGLLRQALARAPEGSAMGMRVALELALAPAQRGDGEAARQGAFELYRSTSDPARRRAIALQSARVGASSGTSDLVYQMVNTWVGSLPPADAERDVGEALYRAVVLERAFDAWAHGELGDARGLFYGATRLLPTLDAHAGFIATARAEGKQDLDAEYAKMRRRDPTLPAEAFLTATRDALAMTEASMAGTGLRAAPSDELLALADQIMRARPLSGEAHHLMAVLLALRFMATGEPQDAAQAYDRALVARDLFADSPRGLAPALELLAMLQAAVGNHHRAFEHFEARVRLPFPTASAEARVLLGYARSLYYADRPRRAAVAAERALALSAPEESTHLVALDRAALYRLAARDGAGAVTHYQRALDHPAARDPAADPDHQLNAWRRHLGLGAALLLAAAPAEAIPPLEWAQSHLDELGTSDLEELPGLEGWTPLEARLAVGGLLGDAYRGAGRWAEAEAAWRTRFAGLERRRALRPRAIDADELATLALQLAELEARDGRQGDALDRLRAALDSTRRAREQLGVAPRWTEAALAMALASLSAAFGDGGDWEDDRLLAQPTLSALIAVGDPALRAEREALAAALALVDAHLAAPVRDAP